MFPRPWWIGSTIRRIFQNTAASRKVPSGRPLRNRSRPSSDWPIRKNPGHPPGGRHGGHGMAVPCRGGIVLDLVRMNKILEIRIEDRLAVVQPGVVYADLQRVLAGLGFFFPPDPASGRWPPSEETSPPTPEESKDRNRHHQGLCPWPGGGPARRTGHAHRLQLYEVGLRLRLNAPFCGLRRNPGGDHRDPTQDQSNAHRQFHRLGRL